MNFYGDDDFSKHFSLNVSLTEMLHRNAIHGGTPLYRRDLYVFLINASKKNHFDCESNKSHFSEKNWFADWFQCVKDTVGNDLFGQTHPLLLNLQ